jgi:hypothetical protein
MWQIRERCIYGFGIGNLWETQHLKGLGIEWRIILKWILKELCVRIWAELLWLRVTISGELLISKA